MKTTARFTVIHGSLYAPSFLTMQQFAQLIPADTYLNTDQIWTDLTVQLDVTLDMESNPPGQKTQISTYFTLQLRDIIYQQKPGALRSFIEHIRRDLFAKIGEFVQDRVEKAAPPMPPEPKPVYIETDIRIEGQQLAFVSTGDAIQDDAISRNLDRTWTDLKFTIFGIK